MEDFLMNKVIGIFEAMLILHVQYFE